ncbi:hypothetical protein ACTWLI_00980 [Arthrobacter sp. Hor0625]|uniref:hypothetical protein n=1 Tax=Arthrobacter sp. Hor0625 TaxID=3457358 RepID=UPI00403E7579
MSIFFWIILLFIVIPAVMRLYRRSSRGRDQGQGLPGGFPGQPFGGFPGQDPGRQSNQPRDGFTQRDYYGGFGQLGAPQPPAGQYPGQQFPGQPYPGAQPPAGQYPGQPYPVPYEDSPEYLNNPPQPGPQQPTTSPDVPPVPPAPSGPQGYRARKLAELDQKYSNGELAMEDYMAQRAEIMKG